MGKPDAGVIKRIELRRLLGFLHLVYKPTTYIPVGCCSDGKSDSTEDDSRLHSLKTRRRLVLG